MLEVGCGTRDLAITLAERRATTLAPAVRSHLEFRAADALRPSVPGTEFGAVVDSGFPHFLEEVERDRFAAELALALRPGGRYYLLAFDVTFPGPNEPRAVTEDELRRRFSPAAGWRVLHCAPATFRSRVGNVEALPACVERTAW